ncbi:DUF1015 family protein [Flavilitoribacter nigricans]|uniref:DUF1015 domain-containing protein n=1 Tax=Flavilitoribacter nigricans (strain ATCC 23147 / DSM 23189 / NBRC 102662 / NCIMB 1420 / SS-2) TaxID=1122177 RepID=A0A2D0N9L4_FLAN2|nr:DUF1015 family protein [Flavilitoribacter nigricans]PHN04473.1 hypothetical protein CRP01_20915 [Flavilitoribacter nigricans DSM 23189 = NBRC 102662]
MNILPFRGLLPNLSLIPDQHHFFESVKEHYNAFQQEQFFLPTAAPAFYVFRMQRARQTATGLICTTHIADYIRGKVLKHEKTIRSKEQIQINLLQERKAAVKPALLVHRHEPAIRSWLREFTRQYAPIQRVVFDDGEIHTLWQVRQVEDQATIQNLFREKLQQVAIADGHHRFASFARLYRERDPEQPTPFAAVMTAYFPEDELEIGAFHRFVELSDTPERQLLAQLARLGKMEVLEDPGLPQRKHQMSIVCESTWYSFTWNPVYLATETLLRPILDVDLLQQHILVGLLQVSNIRTDSRIHYIEGVENVQKLDRQIRSLPRGICFILYPILPDDFLQVSNLGLMLVPKATFFQPRLKNGLIVQPL